MIVILLLFIVVVAILLLPVFVGNNKKQFEKIQDSFETRQLQLKSDYQFRRKEIERRLRMEDINEQELIELNDELDRETASSIEKAQSKNSKAILIPSLGFGIALSLLLISLAGISYLKFGNPDQYLERERLLVMLSQNPATIDYLSKQAETQKNRKSAIELLHAARLLIEIEPFAPNSWLQYGEVEASFGRMEQATLAFRRARQLDPNNKDIKLALSRSLITSEAPGASTEAMLLDKSVLRSDPKNRQALLSLGFSAFQSGEYQQAIDAWEKVLEFKQTTPERAQILHKTIATAKMRLAAQQGKPVKQTENPTKTTKAVTSKASVRIKVSIAEAVKSQLKGSEYLFVFAKAANGPPIPLAVQRYPINQIPEVIQLSDKNAMRPELKMSNFTEIKLTARISISGNAKAQKGDFEAGTSVIKAPFKNQTFDILIH